MDRRSFSILLLAGFKLDMSGILQPRTYGKNISITQATEIADTFEDPSAYIDEEILVNGIVLDVCEERGIWINVVAEGSSDYVMCVLDDKEYSFPQSSVGRVCSVQGTFNRYSSKDELLINILKPRECRRCHKQCIVNSSELAGRSGRRGRGGRGRRRPGAATYSIPDNLNVIFIDGATIS